MRDRSEKPADQCSDNEIGRGLVTDSPVRRGEHAQSKIIENEIYLQGFENHAGKQRIKKTQNLRISGS
ncbi:hypothetical protein [Flavobacterium piscis]|uniref:hypothetical protein n=1 Tax=Flavobacterium piscis TaxID=1114874 RepID=UPI000F4D7060|nr:hypothetical protein [Flavobacterium piscis]